MSKFVGRLTRVTATAPTYVQAQFMGSRIQSSLQRTQHRGCDAGRMPIHAHNAPESLKPVRVTEAAEQFRSAIVIQHAFADGRSHAGHPLREPGWNASTVQWEISNSGPFHEPILDLLSRVRGAYGFGSGGKLGK